MYRPNDDVVVAGLGHCPQVVLRDLKKLVGDLLIFEGSGSESNIVREAVSKQASIKAYSPTD